MKLRNIKTKIYFFVILLFCINCCISFSTEPSKNPIFLKEVGYGRLHTEYIKFYNTDRTADFQSLAENEILPLRKLWIDKFRNNESDNTLNIACIAFDFFNANEERLNEDLIYFKDHKQEMDKYYFIRGRLPWAEIEKEENRTIANTNNVKKVIKREQILCLSQEISDCKNTIKN